MQRFFVYFVVICNIVPNLVENALETFNFF